MLIKKRKQGDKALINKVLQALNACFTKNKNVKKITNRYNFLDDDLRKKMYAEKTRIIKWCIDTIIENKLPIKYGYNLDDFYRKVIYFEYKNKQVSFHDPKDTIKNIKKYNGTWTGVINKKIPFHWV